VANGWVGVIALVLILGFPAAVVLRAAFVNKSKTKLKGSGPVSSPGQISFHQAEFTSLKSEIAELVKAADSNFKYAVVASAGVFTWIATADKVQGHTSLLPLNLSLMRYSVWLPFLLSGLLFSLSAALFIRLNEMAGYLHKIEGALGSYRLGWEEYFRNHPATLGPIYLYGWIVLLTGDWLLAWLLPDYSFALVPYDPVCYG
jgi:hypothetical protein